MDVCRLITNILPLLNNTQTSIDSLHNGVQRLAYRPIGKLNYELYEQWVWIKKPNPETNQAAIKECLIQGTSLFYVMERYNLKDLFKHFKIQETWINLAFDPNLDMVTDANKKQPKMRTEHNTITWDGPMPKVNECTSLKTPDSGDTFTLQKKNCGASLNYLCFELTTVRQGYIKDLTRLKTTMRKLLEEMKTQLQDFQMKWETAWELLPEINTTRLQELGTIERFNLGFTYETPLRNSFNQQRNALLKDLAERRPGLAILTLNFQHLSKTMDEIVEYFNKLKYHTTTLCRTTQKRDSQIYKKGPDLYIHFPTEKSTDKENQKWLKINLPRLVKELLPKNNHTGSIFPNWIKSNLTRMVEEEEDDFYEISLPDIIISFASIVTITIMAIQLILRLTTKPSPSQFEFRINTNEQAATLLNATRRNSSERQTDQHGIPLTQLEHGLKQASINRNLNKPPITCDSWQTSTASSSNSTTPTETPKVSSGRRVWWCTSHK